MSFRGGVFFGWGNDIKMSNSRRTAWDQKVKSETKVGTEELTYLVGKSRDWDIAHSINNDDQHLIPNPKPFHHDIFICAMIIKCFNRSRRNTVSATPYGLSCPSYKVLPPISSPYSRLFTFSNLMGFRQALLYCEALHILQRQLR